MSVSARWGRVKGYFSDSDEELQCFLSVCLFVRCLLPSRSSTGDLLQTRWKSHIPDSCCSATGQEFLLHLAPALPNLGAAPLAAGAMTKQSSNLQIATSLHFEIVFQTEAEDRGRLKRATASKMEVLMEELQRLMKHNGKRISIFSHHMRPRASAPHLKYLLTCRI